MDCCEPNEYMNAYTASADVGTQQVEMWALRSWDVGTQQVLNAALLDLCLVYLQIPVDKSLWPF